ncbi:ECF-type sigma factor [Rubrivirga sp. IMCC43871]|uniref:ECF-type sigma factor n=1 Tax=Rubrivirga sp. IMCC43871 TaxID=3391575 RepID=UPI003990018D
MPSAKTTILLRASRDGDARASDALFERVYGELRRLAQSRIDAEPGVVTISATGLVHDAYLKLVDGGDWADRSHFTAVAARAMRQILTDRARARNAAKRGGSARPVTLEVDLVVLPVSPADQVLAIDAALGTLARRDARLAQLVELRFFGGLDAAEAARTLGVSVRTAARDWGRAKAHLHTLLNE